MAVAIKPGAFLRSGLAGVAAQRGKKLTDAEADALILAAQAIIDVLETL